MATMALSMMLVLVLYFTNAIAEDDNDSGPYGKYNLWRKTLCEYNSKERDDQFKAHEQCYFKLPEKEQAAFKKCVSKVVGENNSTPVVSFYTKACKCKKHFKDLDKCMSDAGINYNLPPTKAAMGEAYECYEEFLKKYGLAKYLPTA